MLETQDRMEHSILFNYDDLEAKLAKYDGREALLHDLNKLDHKTSVHLSAISYYVKESSLPDEIKKQIQEEIKRYEENIQILLKPEDDTLNQMIEEKQMSGDLDGIHCLIKERDERIRKRQRAPNILYGSLRTFVRMIKDNAKKGDYSEHLKSEFFRFVTFWNSFLGMRKDDSLGCYVILDWSERTTEFEGQGIKYFLGFGKNIKTDVDYFSVIDNLLGNALKYAFDSRQLKNRQVNLIVEQDDVHNYHLVSVSDNGVGIPAELIPKIFDEGYTTGNGNGHGKGRGLGLSECKDIVKNAGGTIWAESEVGKGTTFYFTIPYDVCK